MNTIENNLLIALFMGGKLRGQSRIDLAHQDIWLPIHGICRHDTVEIGRGKTLHYHDRWDWLMPVVEKIEMLPCDKTTDQFYLRVEYDNREDFKGWYYTLEQFVRTIKSPDYRYKTKIEACYIAVIEFINYHNQNKPL